MSRGVGAARGGGGWPRRRACPRGLRGGRGRAARGGEEAWRRPGREGDSAVSSPRTIAQRLRGFADCVVRASHRLAAWLATRRPSAASLQAATPPPHWFAATIEQLCGGGVHVVSMLEYGSEEISDCPTSIVRGFRCFPAQVPGFRCVVAPKPGDGVTARSTSGSGITSGSPALPNVQYHDARRGAADAGAGAHADERAPGWPIHVCRHAIGQGRSDGTDLLPSGHVSGRAGGQVSYERAVRKRRLAAGARPER